MSDLWLKHNPEQHAMNMPKLTRHVLVFCVFSSLILVSVLANDDSNEDDSKVGLCVQQQHHNTKKYKVYCTLCSIDVAGVDVIKIIPKSKGKCADKWDKGCKFRNPRVVPVDETEVDTTKHVCGKKNNVFAWYCSYCSVEKNEANFRPRKACKDVRTDSDTRCIGLPKEDTPTTTVAAPTPKPRTVFPPLERLCVPGSQGMSSNCGCPAAPKMGFTLPAIVERSCDSSPPVARGNPQ